MVDFASPGVKVAPLWNEAERLERITRRRRDGDRAEITVAGLLARAFRDNPMNMAVLRRAPERRVRANGVGISALLEAALHRGHVLTGCESEGDVVGALIGFSPGTPSGPVPGVLHELWIALRQGPRVAARWGRVHSELAEIRPVWPHWTLAMVGVHPDAQARGVGVGLLTAWLRNVDEAPAPAYVETDRPELVAFYQRVGFEPFARRTVHGVVVHALVRPEVGT